MNELTNNFIIAKALTAFAHNGIISKVGYVEDHVTKDVTIPKMGYVEDHVTKDVTIPKIKCVKGHVTDAFTNENT